MSNSQTAKADVLEIIMRNEAYKLTNPYNATFSILLYLNFISDGPVLFQCDLKNDLKNTTLTLSKIKIIAQIFLSSNYTFTFSTNHTFLSPLLLLFHLFFTFN